MGWLPTIKCHSTEIEKHFFTVTLNIFNFIIIICDTPKSFTKIQAHLEQELSYTL